MHRLEPLAKAHDRDGFDCGNQPLNLYLKQTARQHAERGISRTFVLVDEAATPPKPIIGFFSLSICQIKSGSLTPQEARKLPRDVAGVRLGRLAVAKANQGQGIGKTLLVAAMGKFIEIFNSAGGIGLFVDAKDLSNNYTVIWMPRSSLITIGTEGPCAEYASAYDNME